MRGPRPRRRPRNLVGSATVLGGAEQGGRARQGPGERILSEGTTGERLCCQILPPFVAFAASPGTWEDSRDRSGVRPGSRTTRSSFFVFFRAVTRANGEHKTRRRYSCGVTARVADVIGHKSSQVPDWGSMS